MLIKSINKGFTILELVVIAPIIVLAVAGIMTALAAIVNSVAIQSANISSINGVQFVYDRLEQDIKYGLSYFPSTLPASLSDMNSPVGGVDYKYRGTLKNGTSNTDLNTVFIQSYNQTSSTTSNLSNSSLPVTWGNCGSTLKINSMTGIPLAVIYYVNQGTLYRRTVVHNDTFNSSIAKCGTPRIQQSCQSPPQTKCTVRDQAILQDVTQFKINYYLNSTDSLPINAYDTTPSVSIDQAKSIEVTIRTDQTVVGERIEYQSSMRINRK